MHPDLIARLALRRLGIECQIGGKLDTPRCWVVALPSGEVRWVSGATLRLMAEKRIRRQDETEDTAS